MRVERNRRSILARRKAGAAKAGAAKAGAAKAGAAKAGAATSRFESGMVTRKEKEGLKKVR